MLRDAHGIAPAVLACLLLVGTDQAAAQGSKKSQDSKSEQVIEKVIQIDTGDGPRTQHLRRVMRDGKVVEESGDPGLGDIKIKVLKDSDQESHTRRVVVVNGETVVDEETVNGKPVKPGSKRVIHVGGSGEGMEDLHRHLQEMMKGHGGDRERLHEHLKELGGASKHASDSDSSSTSHRVVIVNGEKVVDEKTENGKPVHSLKADELSKHLRVEIERLLDDDLDDLPARLHKELERSLKGHLKDLPKEDLHERVRVRLHEDLKDLPSRIHEELGRTLKRDLGRIHEQDVDATDLHQRLESELRKIHQEFEGPEMDRVHEKIKKALERHGLDDFLERGHGPIQIRVQKKDGDKDAKKASRPRGIKV